MLRPTNDDSQNKSAQTKALTAPTDKRKKNTRTERSIIVTDDGVEYELVPRMSKEELHDLAKHNPGLKIEDIVTRSPKENNEKEYKILIGEGYHSKVRLARLMTTNHPKSGQYVVVKKVHSTNDLARKHSNGAMDHEAKRAEILKSSSNESKIKELINHISCACISHACAITSKKNQPNTPQLYQFMDLAAWGSLSDLDELLTKLRIDADKHTALLEHISNQMIHAIIRLHSNSTVRHRDIKPDNFVLTNEGKILLVDFGSAAYKTKDAQWKTISLSTTKGYQPPESYLGVAVLNHDQYYRMHDEWALAITLLEVWGISNYNIDCLKKIAIDDNKNKEQLTPPQKHEQNLNKLRKVKTAIEESYKYNQIPEHIKQFICDALELNHCQRKSHISQMYPHHDASTKNTVSETIEEINSKIRTMNDEYLDESPTPDNACGSAASTANSHGFFGIQQTRECIYIDNDMPNNDQAAASTSQTFGY